MALQCEALTRPQFSDHCHLSEEYTRSDVLAAALILAVGSWRFGTGKPCLPKRGLSYTALYLVDTMLLLPLSEAARKLPVTIHAAYTGKHALRAPTMQRLNYIPPHWRACTCT